MSIKKYQEFIKVYEGLKKPYDILSEFINQAIESGAEPTLVKNTIKVIINYHNGERTLSKYAQGSDESRAIDIINDGIDSALDAGYSETDIYEDLEKIYNQMK